MYVGVILTVFDLNFRELGIPHVCGGDPQFDSQNCSLA